MSEIQSLEARLQQLRDAFDESFAHEATRNTADAIDMLEISVGKERFLVRVSHVRNVHAARPIAKLPTDSMSLLGLVGLRGAIVAVHDLGALLGVTTDRSAPWLLVARQAPIALAFQGLERHLKVRTDALLSSPDQRVRGAEAAFDDGTRRTVIEIDHVVAQLLATPSVHERDKTHGE